MWKTITPLFENNWEGDHVQTSTGIANREYTKSNIASYPYTNQHEERFLLIMWLTILLYYDAGRLWGCITSGNTRAAWGEVIR